MLVFDGANARMSVLDPGWAEVRTAPIPNYPWSAAILESRDIIVNADVRDPDRIGRPYHRFDAMGNYLDAFGDEPGESVLPGDISGRMRWIAPGHGSTFWSLRLRRQYVVELWDVSGQRLRQLVRDAEWFRPYDRDRPTTREDPPQAEGVAIWFDRATGWIWTILNVPDPNWRSGLGAPQRMEGQTAYPIVDFQRVFDTVVEVLDPENGRVVARRRFDGTIDMANGFGVVAGAREREDGTPYVQLWRIVLRNE
jgi:hypothetical protein